MKLDRRAFFAKAWAVTKAVLAGSIALPIFARLRHRLVEVVAAPPAQAPLRPPGALAEDAFRARCIRCYLCGYVCPPECIRFPSRVVGAQPSKPLAPPDGAPPTDGATVAAGPPDLPVWEGDGTPYVLPWVRACTMCMRCGKICPTGALQPIADEREAIKERTGMGYAHIDRKICLPWTRVSWCGACYTVCPFREEAITVDHQNRPTIHALDCTGCGLCVEVCPIRYKAIAIVPPYRPDRGRVRAE